jgi:methyl-accepting chemotaxis protein
LNHIETKVVDSYKESVLVGENYDKDAEYINGLVTDFSATSEELLSSIRTVSEAISEISKANTEGAAGTNDIADKVSKIRDKANKVRVETNKVEQSADYLKNIVSKFKV